MYPERDANVNFTWEPHHDGAYVGTIEAELDISYEYEGRGVLRSFTVERVGLGKRDPATNKYRTVWVSPAVSPLIALYVAAAMTDADLRREIEGIAQQAYEHERAYLADDAADYRRMERVA